ncbi:hypothetical protein KHQ06_29365 [Nocardia tengchongensis]|uniref:Uncharacterized protein n=1 Tax=Nocardia tengchongensis TaxID=2055889 RepID=A0ABX8CMU0_9NOCA|nr:hypothetical protein [Nocardia tengchongensis]QVI20273.1 hypothetical protein KHQ06_29365 [Nocardia tengchongensis]
MTTARISASLAAAPARAYGPASCVPGDPTRPTGELFATTNTATITDPADPRLNDRLELLELDESFTALTELALPSPRDRSTASPGPPTPWWPSAWAAVPSPNPAT